MTKDEPIPVVVFAYARPQHLTRVLACLRENRVPLIRVYADGAKGAADATRVAEVRALVRTIDWCELEVVERRENLGLGRNVLAGVTEVAACHSAFVVWEDDLVCAPGTYAWLCAALRRYADDPRVMSVTGWTHPRVRPADVGESPYFDGRAESWSWGAWSRSWNGMGHQTATAKMAELKARGEAADAYGMDLPPMAREEERKNIWAVRWVYHHLLRSGACLRPPWSMVEHIGFDATATNAVDGSTWSSFPLRGPPPLPVNWPEPRVHADCSRLWRASTRRSPFDFVRQIFGRLRSAW